MKKDTKKKILTFLEMEFSSPNIKNILIFSQKKALLKFREIELFRKWNFLASYFPYISGSNSPSSKNSKNTQGTCEAWKSNKKRFFRTTYYCIGCSLDILFSATGFLITYSIIDIWQNFGYVLEVKRKQNICAYRNEITLQIILITFEGVHLQ